MTVTFMTTDSRIGLQLSRNSPHIGEDRGQKKTRLAEESTCGYRFERLITELDQDSNILQGIDYGAHHAFPCHGVPDTEGISFRRRIASGDMILLFNDC